MSDTPTPAERAAERIIEAMVSSGIVTEDVRAIIEEETACGELLEASCKTLGFLGAYFEPSDREYDDIKQPIRWLADAIAKAEGR
jgi:hypothetical protein